MAKAPLIGQRSIRAESVANCLEVILKSGKFLNHRVARRNQVWLVSSLSHEESRLDGGPTLERIAQGDGLALCAAGSWTARFASDLEQLVGDAERLQGSRPNIFIDVSQVSKLDTFGAWLIERLRRSLTQAGAEAKIAGLSANYSSLVDEVRRVKDAPVAEASPVTLTRLLD